VDDVRPRSSTRSGPLPWWELLGKMKVVPFLLDWKRVCSFCGHHTLGATLAFAAQGTTAANEGKAVAEGLKVVEGSTAAVYQY
jgi:hypothetical protein